MTATFRPPGLPPASAVNVPEGTRYEWDSPPSADLSPGFSLTFTIVGTWSPTGPPAIVRNRAVAGGDTPCGAIAAVSTATVIPLPGANLLAEPDDSFVDLSWLAVAGASQLRLYRREGDVGPLLLRFVLPPTTTAFTDVRVENGVTYTYVLVGADALGAETVQGTATATPLIRGWPMFQRSALHDAYDPSTNIQPPLGERWRATVKLNGVGAYPLQTAVVVSGTLWTPPTMDDTQARRATTGEVLWQAGRTVTATADTLTTAAVHHGKVYLAHPEGLTVRWADTGVVDWQLQTNSTANFGDSNPGSPIVYKGVLYAPFRTSGDWRLVAIDVDPSSTTYQMILWESTGLVDRAYGTP
ncbi:MAG: hypothetical protein AAB368_03810, partial [bacterium]